MPVAERPDPMEQRRPAHAHVPPSEPLGTIPGAEDAVVLEDMFKRARPVRKSFAAPRRLPWLKW